MEDFQKQFILQLADNVMILGQRLGEWCGHGPVLEQDIAVTNIALDLIGEARNYYQYLAEVEGLNEDDYPMKRDVREFRNILLVELENGHWGDTIMRQFMFDCFHYFMLDGLVSCKDQRLASIAKKSLKEARYHLKFSGEWVIRLGDGTDVSNKKIQQSLENLMPYFGEMFTPSDAESWCIENGICPNLNEVKQNAYSKFDEVIKEATLIKPENVFDQLGGKKGLHTEKLGFILAEMQYLQRAHPDANW